MHYDRNGKLIGDKEWLTKFEDESYRRVARDTVTTPSGDELFISTVWLGIDHRFDFEKDQRPVLFETMVFDNDTMTQLHMERYCTLEEAREGHARIVKRIDDGSFNANREGHSWWDFFQDALNKNGGDP